MRIDQPPDPASDLAREGDAVPDKPVQQDSAPVAGDTERAEPRTRHEHFDAPPEPDEPTELPAETERREPAAGAVPDERDSPEPAGPDDSPVNREADDNQDQLPGDEGPPPGPNVDGERPPIEDPPDDRPEPKPSQEVDGPQNPESPQPTHDTTPSPDHPHPLTDAEWTEHITDVREGLGKAYEEGHNTNHAYTIDGKGEVWLEARTDLHDAILEDIYAGAAEVPCEFKAIVAGGLGGAGKTTVLTEHAGIDMSKYLMINPDDLKVEMARRGMIPEIDRLSPMEASELVHEESSYLAKRLARRAQADGKNVIWDITMSSEGSTAARISDLHQAGYTQIDGLFVDVSIEVSTERMESRHREGHEKWREGNGLGGRYVPPEVASNQVDSEWGSKNRKTYEAMKEQFDNWSTYDNSMDRRPPLLIERSQRANP